MLTIKPQNAEECPFLYRSYANGINCRVAEEAGTFDATCVGLDNKHCPLNEEGGVEVKRLEEQDQELLAKRREALRRSFERVANRHVQEAACVDRNIPSLEELAERVIALEERVRPGCTQPVGQPTVQTDPSGGSNRIQKGE